MTTMKGSEMIDTLREDRILRYAVCFETGEGVTVFDPTASFISLSRVAPAILAELTEAAELADVSIHVRKVGDEARADVTGVFA